MIGYFALTLYAACNACEVVRAADTVAFANGMAAIAAVMELFRPGDHIISGEDLYGGSNRLFHTVNEKNGVRFDFTDTTDLSSVERLIRPMTRAIYVESPTNPTMRVTDIAAGLARQNARCRICPCNGGKSLHASMGCSIDSAAGILSVL